MIDWENTNREFWGTSNAPCWKEAVSDIAEMLSKAFAECVAVQRTAIYVEMWPDSGGFICYPAEPPDDGELAERDSDFYVQLRIGFWAEAWHRISLDETDSETRYERLRFQAIEALMRAYEQCEPHDNIGDIVLYAFEFEGSEGFAVISRGKQQ